MVKTIALHAASKIGLAHFQFTTPATLHAENSAYYNNMYVASNAPTTRGWDMARYAIVKVLLPCRSTKHQSHTPRVGQQLALPSPYGYAQHPASQYLAAPPQWGSPSGQFAICDRRWSPPDQRWSPPNPRLGMDNSQANREPSEQSSPGSGRATPPAVSPTVDKPSPTVGLPAIEDKKQDADGDIADHIQNLRKILGGPSVDPPVKKKPSALQTNRYRTTIHTQRKSKYE